MRPARKTLRRPDELIAAGLIPPERRGEIEAVAARYALALTADVAELIDPADPRDPIARQFVPAAAELDARAEEMADSLPGRHPCARGGMGSAGAPSRMPHIRLAVRQPDRRPAAV